MKSLDQRLSVVEQHVKNNKMKVMIIGLGSVGAYLLDYLMSRNDEAIDIISRVMKQGVSADFSF